MSGFESGLEDKNIEQFIEVTETGDDAGLIITEQFSVGTPTNPKESVFGAGDSYPIGKSNVLPSEEGDEGCAWHCTEANTTGQTITSATDVTNIFASDNGSTTGLFGGTAAGAYLLVGSDIRYTGIKVKIDTAGSVAGANVVGQFFPHPSVGWLPVVFMVTDVSWPYEQRANNIATEDDTSEHWRFGFDPTRDRFEWAKTTMNINGTDYTKYWARFIVLSTIVTDPIIEQIKMHTDRVEINGDGVMERFGLAIYPKTLLSGVDRLVTNVGLTPSDQNINYQTGVTEADYNNNQFTDNKVDSGILVQNMVYGMHTGVPLMLDISYYTETASTGDVEWEAHVYKVADGFVYDGTATPTVYTAVDTIETGAAFTRRTVTILIFVNELTYDDQIVIDLRRDATAGNSDDTLSDNCVVTNVRLTGHFWTP